MNASAVELFAHAAERARDVALIMDAARALTLLGRSRLCGDARDPAASDLEATQVIGLYHTAERLGQHVRQMSCEARGLLLTARQLLEAEPESCGQLPPDFAEVCRQMDEAMDRAVDAIDRLAQVRESSVPAGDAGPAPWAVQQEVDALLGRLRGAAR